MKWWFPGMWCSGAWGNDGIAQLLLEILHKKEVVYSGFGYKILEVM